ncbi:MAG: zinc-dependent alcohol dehydrogenase family protein [Arenicellales bacterium]
MKSMIIRNFGGSNVFESAEITKPEVKPGHVLVKIAATSINTVDTMIREMGKELPISPELPAVLGMDFSGTVESVGEGVSEYNIGDEVYGCAGGLGDLPGTLAEYLVADANLIAHKPKTITMREAAALPLVGITAYEGLTRAGIAQGQKVLVHGGAGGVGHVALQIARHYGAEVYATGGSNKKLKLIKELGGMGINYKTEAVADYVDKYTDGAGFDLVFDSVGGLNMANSFEAAALNGQVVSTVALVELDLSVMHFKGLSLHVVFMLIPMIHEYKREEHANILRKLADIVDAGELRPVVDEQKYSLEEVGKAHDRLSSGQAIGKVVVEI